MQEMQRFVPFRPLLHKVHMQLRCNLCKKPKGKPLYLFCIFTLTNHKRYVKMHKPASCKSAFCRHQPPPKEQPK
jgi:hypothetical protein